MRKAGGNLARPNGEEGGGRGILPFKTMGDEGRYTYQRTLDEIEKNQGSD